MVKNGNHNDATEELLQFLNFDFRLSPALLRAVAKLHTDAIIVDKEVVFILVAEAYDRAKSIDVHGETNLKSLPTPTDSFYGPLSVGVHEKSDGNAVKRKLKVGSSTMYILVTMSVCLSAGKYVNVCPETSENSWQSRPSTARIVFSDVEANRFLQTMKNPATQSMQNC